MIDFSNASVLSYNHSPKFIGENLRYSITKNLSIQGWILSSTFSGVSGIYSGINYLVNGATDYQQISINGNNFGQGKVLEFSFDKNEENKDVLYKKYTASLEVYSSGNLYNALSGYYSGLTWQTSGILDKFDESFSYSRNQDNSSQYTQQVNIRFNSGQNLPDTPIGMAKSFASGFFENLNLTGFLGLSYNKFYKEYFTETYNLIDNSVSYKQDVEFPIESGVYAITYKHIYELGEDGIINISENGNIKGLYNPIYQSLQMGIAEELPNTFNRCSGIFYLYSPSGAYPLNINAAKKNSTINKFEGTASYDVQYTNNPKYQTTYLWDYTTTIDVNVDRVYTVTEQGKIEGIGRRLINKYQNAQGGYQIVASGISGRVYDVYDSANPYPLTLNCISTTQGFSYYQGNISYSQVYSDDITLFPASGIRKFELTISDKIPVQAVNKFNIVGVKELIQPTNQSTLGERQIAVQMIGNRGLPISNYLTYAQNQLTGYKNVGTDIWTSNVDYKYDPINNTFGLNLIYNYDGQYKAFSDIIFGDNWII